MPEVLGVEAAALWLALGAGVVAAVNPCGFALLPAYLSLFVLTGEEPSPVRAVGRALRATAALTLGFGLVFLLFGLVVSPFAGAVQAYLPAFTMVLGVSLALAGGWVAAGRSVPTPRLGRRGASSGRPIVASWRAMTGFGASYAVASLGCTIAPFLAVVVSSFRSTSPLAGVVLFLAYSLGMGLMVGAAAIAVALARRGVVTRMRRAGGLAARAGGVVLAVAGLYVAWYGVWELRVLHGGAGQDPVVTAAAAVQEWLSGLVQWVGPQGFAFALAAVAVLVLVLSRRGRRTSTEVGDSSDTSVPRSAQR